MGKIDELIQRYCPDGVEYVRFGDALSVNRGKRLTKMQLSDDGQYYVYHGSKDTPLGKYSQFNVKGNTTIVVNTGGIGGVKFCDDDFWCSDGSFWIGHSDLFNDKYVYYYLSPLEPYFASQKRVGGVPTIDRSVVENIEIPVPPLPVQEEIVKILDNFTNLAAELQAELQARQQQYQYYRDSLLSFDGRDDVEWKKLGEVSTIYGRIGFRGYTAHDMVKKGEGAISLSPGNIQNNSLTFNDCKYISWEKYEESPEIKIQNGDVVFVKTGSTVGKVGYVKELTEKTTLNPQLVVFKNLKINAKYLYYVLCKADIQVKVKALAGVGSVPNISQNNIAKIEIPIPPFAEQQRIVDVLDRFDTLTTDLFQGLPAEIETRRQQYEYYRDQLLTFKRKEA